MIHLRRRKWKPPVDYSQVVETLADELGKLAQHIRKHDITEDAAATASEAGGIDDTRSRILAQRTSSSQGNGTSR